MPISPMPVVPGVAQTSTYNPQNSNYAPAQGSSLPITNPAIGSTMSPSATAPGTPKQKYIQNKVAPATPDNNVSGNQDSNAAYLGSNPGIFGGSQQQTPGQNGSNNSQNINSQGVYDPYQSPAYQQYLQNYIKSQMPGLDTPTIQNGIVAANQGLTNLQSIYANNIQADVNNPGLSQGALTGQEAAEAQVLAAKSVPYQTQINLLNNQQQQAGTAYGAGLTSAGTEASYLGGIAKPTTLAPGQTLTTTNPTTGQTTPLASIPNISAISNPLSPSGISTINQTSGAVGSPSLSGPGSPGSSSDLATQYLQNPIIAGYVQATKNSNGDMSAAGVPSQYQAAVNTVLQAQSNGQYSPGNASINQANLASQQATANALIAPAQTAVQHLADLQSLANAVNYSNSPISNQLRNQFSGSILTDPNITTLQSAIGVVRSEVAKILGGGSPTVASQKEATDALPDNLSPSNIAGVIANVQSLMNAKISSYSDPNNTAKLNTGLQMPSGYSSSNENISSLDLKL